MSWVYLMYGNMDHDGKSLRNSICPPHFAKKRAAYVKEKYGEDPVIKKIDSCHLDFGGMIHTDDPYISIQLGTGREFTCWSHQASFVLDAISRTESKPRKPRDGVYFRFQSFPVNLIFLSGTDLKKIKKALISKVDAAMEQAHEVAMLEALVDANQIGSPEVPREEIKAVLVGHRERGKGKSKKLVN